MVYFTYFRVVKQNFIGFLAEEMPLIGKVSKKPPATPITRDRGVGFKTDDRGEWNPRMFESVGASPHQVEDFQRIRNLR